MRKLFLYTFFTFSFLHFSNVFAQTSCSNMKNAGNLFTQADMTNSVWANVKIKLKVKTTDPNTETSTSWSNDVSGAKYFTKNYKYQGIAEMLINKNKDLGSKSCSEVLGLVSEIWVVAKAVGSSDSSGKVNCNKATDYTSASKLSNIYSDNKYFYFEGQLSGDLVSGVKCHDENDPVYTNTPTSGLKSN